MSELALHHRQNRNHHRLITSMWQQQHESHCKHTSSHFPSRQHLHSFPFINNHSLWWVWICFSCAVKICFCLFFFHSLHFHLPPSTFRPNYLSLADSPLSTPALKSRHYESEMGQLMVVWSLNKKQERAEDENRTFTAQETTQRSAWTFWGNLHTEQ